MDPLKHNSVKYLFSSTRHRDVVCPWHFNAFMEIALADEGVFTAHVGEKDYRVPKGMGVFIPPFVPHYFSSPEHNRTHVLMFTGSLVSYFADFLEKHEAETALFTPSAESLLLVESILPKETNDLDFIHGQAVLAPLCCDIFNQCGFVARKSRGDDSLSKALEFINEHFAEPITMESTARALGIHPVTLSRNLSQQGKTSFNSYLNYLRCSHAAVLLKVGDGTVAEAAYSVGFGSIRSFNRAFKGIYGVTPTSYRKTPNI